METYVMLHCINECVVVVIIISGSSSSIIINFSILCVYDVSKELQRIRLKMQDKI